MGLISSFHGSFLALLTFSLISRVFMQWCPEGWLSYKRYCYGFHDKLLSWHLAEEPALWSYGLWFRWWLNSSWPVRVRIPTNLPSRLPKHPQPAALISAAGGHFPSLTRCRKVFPLAGPESEFRRKAEREHCEAGRSITRSRTVFLNLVNFKADCNTHDTHSHLASILSPAEMQKLAIWLLIKLNVRRPIWIGMYSIRGVRRKRWRWIDLALTHYTNWKATEPNDAGRKEDCVMMENDSGTLQWADANCSLQYSYLCKISH